MAKVQCSCRNSHVGHLIREGRVGGSESRACVVEGRIGGVDAIIEKYIVLGDESEMDFENKSIAVRSWGKYPVREGDRWNF